MHDTHPEVGKWLASSGRGHIRYLRGAHEPYRRCISSVPSRAALASRAVAAAAKKAASFGIGMRRLITRWLPVLPSVIPIPASHGRPHQGKSRMRESRLSGIRGRGYEAIMIPTPTRTRLARVAFARTIGNSGLGTSLVRNSYVPVGKMHNERARSPPIYGFFTCADFRSVWFDFSSISTRNIGPPPVCCPSQIGGWSPRLAPRSIFVGHNTPVARPEHLGGRSNCALSSALGGTAAPAKKTERGGFRLLGSKELRTDGFREFAKWMRRVE